MSHITFYGKYFLYNNVKIFIVYISLTSKILLIDTESVDGQYYKKPMIESLWYLRKHYLNHHTKINVELERVAS